MVDCTYIGGYRLSIENFSLPLRTTVSHVITESNFMSDGSLHQEYTNHNLLYLITG